MPKRNNLAASNTTEPFNPLEKVHLGQSIADALLAQPVHPLPPSEHFTGAGIYALYYVGSHELYDQLAGLNRKGKFGAPIYVGKAIPKGGRKGGFSESAPSGTPLYSRLTKHAASIKGTPTLELSDFHCRYLVVDDIWIPLGEALLITRFRPLWNHVIEGFGINDPGKGRHGQQVSHWDKLHPGRSWVRNLKGEDRSLDLINERVRAYYKDHLS